MIFYHYFYVNVLCKTLTIQKGLKNKSTYINLITNTNKKNILAKFIKK